MKEIKIRAWDDELKEMIYSRTEQFDDSLGFRFEKHFVFDLIKEGMPNIRISERILRFDPDDVLDWLKHKAS